jgi:hypothetical protein
MKFISTRYRETVVATKDRIMFSRLEAAAHEKKNEKAKVRKAEGQMGEAIPRRLAYCGPNYIRQIVSLRLPVGYGLGRRDDGEGGLARRQDSRQEIGDAETRASRPPPIVRAVLRCGRR